jgi:glutathione S-transferase
MRGGLAYLEGRLDGEWLALGRFTQADLTTAALIGYLKLRMREFNVSRDYPRLCALAARCEAMPAFEAARPSPDEVMPA